MNGDSTWLAGHENLGRSRWSDLTELAFLWSSHRYRSALRRWSLRIFNLTSVNLDDRWGALFDTVDSRRKCMRIQLSFRPLPYRLSVDTVFIFTGSHLLMWAKINRLLSRAFKKFELHVIFVITQPLFGTLSQLDSQRAVHRPRQVASQIWRWTLANCLRVATWQAVISGPNHPRRCRLNSKCYVVCILWLVNRIKTVLCQAQVIWMGSHVESLN